MLTCEQVAAQATDYMEATAPLPRRLGIWAHLRICPNCREYLRQLAQTIGLLQRSPTPPPDTATEDALVALFAAQPKRD